MKTINIRKTFYIQSSVWRRGDRTARIDIINRLFNRALYIESSDCLNYIKSTNDYKNV